LSTKTLDDLALALGQNLSLDLGNAELGGDGLSGRPIIPSEHRHADADVLQALMAAGVVGLIGSAMAMMPAALPSIATKMAVAPSLRIDARQ
jgi:hypothetical protein